MLKLTFEKLKKVNFQNIIIAKICPLFEIPDKREHDKGIIVIAFLINCFEFKILRASSSTEFVSFIVAKYCKFSVW